MSIVIRFVSTSAKFDTCNGRLVEDKINTFKGGLHVHILALPSVPLTLSTVQVPNLALTDTKLITVYIMGPA